jgi:hypothetical protein
MAWEKCKACMQAIYMLQRASHMQRINVRLGQKPLKIMQDA